MGGSAVRRFFSNDLSSAHVEDVYTRAFQLLTLDELTDSNLPAIRAPCDLVNMVVARKCIKRPSFPTGIEINNVKP